MTLKIKRIEKEDKHGIYEILNAVNEVDHLGYSLTEQWLDHVIENAGEGVLLGYCNNKLVGLATCMINSVDKSHATLNVVVHPSFRSQGFGSMLYNKIIEYAQKQQVKLLQTYVKKRLGGAIAFTKKRKFQVALYSWQMELVIDKKAQENNASFQKKNDFIFRKAMIADGQAYSKVIHECFGDELGEETLEHVLKDPSVLVYMLEHKGEIIGSTTMQLRKNLLLGYIYDVAVIKGYRGQGLGEYLLGQCICELKQEGITTASLLVAGENKNALALYKKLGFKEIDTDLIMEKNL